jgi:hypothetical protein
VTVQELRGHQHHDGLHTRDRPPETGRDRPALGDADPIRPSGPTRRRWSPRAASGLRRRW